MLPTYEECQRQLQQYKKKSQNDPRLQGYETEWNNFQKYKHSVESAGCSMLDDQNVYNTCEQLTTFLNKFGACRPGSIADKNTLAQKLKGIADPYGNIQSFVLGQGKMKSARESLSAVYKGLLGISDIDKVDNGNSLVVPKSKALMALWGQTPGFDKNVRKNLRKWVHQPEPLRIKFIRGLGPDEWRYSAEEFCDIIEELDQWVFKWSQNNEGRSFNSLCEFLNRKEPVGRIIDILYWSHENSNEVTC